MVWSFPLGVHSTGRGHRDRSNTEKIRRKRNESSYIGGKIKENEFSCEIEQGTGEHARDEIRYTTESVLFGLESEIPSFSPLINGGFFPVCERCLLGAWVL